MDLPRDLRHLARWYGIQPDFRDNGGQVRTASVGTVLTVLRMLGCDIDRAEQAADRIRHRRRELWSRVLEPVTVAWDGRGAIRLRLPSEAARGPVRLVVEFDGGGTATHAAQLDHWSVVRRRTIGEESFVALRFEIPDVLPPGYHAARVELPTGTHRTRILSAPTRAYVHPALHEGRSWGVFLPLHAMHGAESWGAGDLSDLAALVAFVEGLGGNLVATLPLLASEDEFGRDPSPYSPTSRLVWNEFFLDLRHATGFDTVPEVRTLLADADFRREIDDLQSRATVDYARQSRLRWMVLRHLSRAFFATDSPARSDLEAFAAERPKALCMRRSEPWPEWPAPLRHGAVHDGDFDSDVFESYLFAQWEMHRQLHALSDQARRAGTLWYLDFALGVGRSGLDVRRQPQLFALDASGCAPPDAFFTRGQDRGFPPLHPERIREDGYRDLVKSLRRHLEYAGLLRIDHVMGLHRPYWVPVGRAARNGVYVRYRAEETFAILCRESHRSRSTVVGENLGTVPEAVDDALRRHGILDMYVVQYEADPDAEPPLRTVQSSAVASLNTHDMPTFAGFWTGLDVDDRVALGLLDVTEAATERARRARLRQGIATLLRGADLLAENVLDPRETADAVHAWLGSGPAACVLVNLEDLWLETRPQNTPGTVEERVNWRRRSRLSLEEIAATRTVRAGLEDLARRRRRG